MTSNFPPFRAAPPKGEQRKEPADETLKPLASELEKLLNSEDDRSVRITSDGKVEPLDEDFGKVQHVEHVRCCAKCFSTEVVEAVRIGDAIYIKVS